MQVTVSRSRISGNLQAPASKSGMQRACAAALLHRGITTIYNPGTSEDDHAALNIVQQLGAIIILKNNILKIISAGFPANDPVKILNINCGESGLSVRMFTPILALSSSKITITGKGSLLSRPMDFFEKMLPQLGVKIATDDGKLPFHLQGPFFVKDITVDGSLSSQFLTGLLFAYAKAAKEQVTITVNDLKSKPYIDLTIEILAHFGYNIHHHNYQKFTIHPQTILSGDIDYTVEGDWSGAAFLLVAGAVAGNIWVKGLNENSTQGDKAILSVLKDCGAITNNEQPSTIYIKKPTSLKRFSFDATDCPDLFPPLVALAANCRGTSMIRGTHRLQSKESDRATALIEVFGKMNIEISVVEDVMYITGGNIISAEINSFHDHRIAMAAAVAGLNADAITINDAEAINKSYPAFFDDLRKAGALIEITNNK